MRDRVISGRACRLVMLAFSISLFGVTGCASSQLSPEEQSRYDQLIAERDQISSERAQLAQQVQSDFTKSGRLETKHKALVKNAALSCGFTMSDQSFGPLPFKKKRGKTLKFGAAKSSARTGCKKHSLKIK